MTTIETIPPQFPALPKWPETPEPVDPAATSYLVIAIGSASQTSEVARSWVQAAEAVAATRLLCLDSMNDAGDITQLDEALSDARTGVRIMVVGGQFDVITALTRAREAGAIPAELTSFVVHTDDLPIYCAHCRGTHRVQARPGDEVTCPGCARDLTIHGHFASAIGSFLASDAHPGEI